MLLCMCDNQLCCIITELLLYTALSAMKLTTVVIAQNSGGVRTNFDEQTFGEENVDKVTIALATLASLKFDWKKYWY